MKRIIFVLLAIFMCFGLCAQGKAGLGLTVNVHPLGYMNHTDITQYNKTDADSKLGKVLDEISGQSGTLWIESDAKQTDIYNAYAFGVDIRYSFFYLGLNLGLPAKIYSKGKGPLTRIDTAPYKEDKRLGQTIIADMQFGVGFPFIMDKSVNFFLGAGLSLNYVRVKREIKKESKLVTVINKLINDSASVKIDTMSEYRNVWNAGLGVKAEMNYNFTSSIALNLSMSDSILFVKAYNQTVYSGRFDNGKKYKYSLVDNKKKGQNEKNDDEIKYRFANNFTAKLGLSIRF